MDSKEQGDYTSSAFWASVGTAVTEEDRSPWQMSVPGSNKFGLLVVTLGLLGEARGIPGKDNYNWRRGPALDLG